MAEVGINILRYVLFLNQYCSETPKKSFFNSIGHFPALPHRNNNGRFTSINRHKPEPKMGRCGGMR
jgi:hypothetical protein